MTSRVKVNIFPKHHEIEIHIVYNHDNQEKVMHVGTYVPIKYSDGTFAEYTYEGTIFEGQSILIKEGKPDNV